MPIKMAKRYRVELRVFEELEPPSTGALAPRVFVSGYVNEFLIPRIDFLQHGTRLAEDVLHAAVGGLEHHIKQAVIDHVKKDFK